MTPLETYLVSVPSVAFALMAKKLAATRTWPNWPKGVDPAVEDFALATRESAAVRPEYFCGSTAYYRVIDRIARGEQP
jgi:hypothetical protein